MLIITNHFPENWNTCAHTTVSLLIIAFMEFVIYCLRYLDQLLGSIWVIRLLSSMCTSLISLHVNKLCDRHKYTFILTKFTTPSIKTKSHYIDCMLQQWTAHSCTLFRIEFVLLTRKIFSVCYHCYTLKWNSQLTLKIEFICCYVYLNIQLIHVVPFKATGSRFFFF